jgi:molybdopterin-containing oxidoreductase family iron-sulfur binding subunit
MAKQYALVFDLKRCIGCHTCTVACKMENNLGTNIQWIKVLTIGGTHTDTPKGEYPNLSLYWQPVGCMHCQKPPCVDVCAAEALYKRKDGIVLNDRSKCTGCLSCVTACPYEVPQYHAEENVISMCTLCVQRIDEGLRPFCLEQCPGRAIYFGDIKESESLVSKLIRERKGYMLKPEANTLPSVHYLEP